LTQQHSGSLAKSVDDQRHREPEFRERTRATSRDADRGPNDGAAASCSAHVYRGQIDDAFASIVERKADGIIYSASVFFQVMRDKLVALAARYSIPAIYEWPEFTVSGGLMSYSSDRSEAGRQMGTYTGLILKGAKPSELPVMQSTKFEFIINLKTAKALGLTIPPTLLATADRVIE
jgi:ABC-type uncharacterized transport system substrate-binding protein